MACVDSPYHQDHTLVVVQFHQLTAPQAGYGW